MTNLELLDSLAHGYNPTTGEKFQVDDPLRTGDVVSRLFDLTIEFEKFVNSQKSKKITNLDAFDFNAIEINSIVTVEPYTTISVISKNISTVTNIGTGTLTKRIGNFLVDKGYLELLPKVDEDGNYKSSTDLGNKIGISNHTSKSEDGREYIGIHYSIEAQKFIISHLAEILK